MWVKAGKKWGENAKNLLNKTPATTDDSLQVLHLITFINQEARAKNVFNFGKYFFFNSSHTELFE